MKNVAFQLLTALCSVLTLLPTVAAAEKTLDGNEVKTSDELVEPWRTNDKAVVKLVENTAAAPGGRRRVGLKLSLWRRRPIITAVRSPAARSRPRPDQREITGGCLTAG